MRRAHGEAEALAVVRDLRDVIDAELPTEADVLNAGRIKGDFAMTYADAFAAATAIAHDATLWTGDPGLLVADAPWTWRDLRVI